MAIVKVDAADVEGSINTTTGNIDLTDSATSLLVWGSIETSMLKNTPLLRRALLEHEVQINNDRPGAWSLIKGVRDKVLSDLGLELRQI